MQNSEPNFAFNPMILRCIYSKIAHKVRTFWEAHKNLRNLPDAFDIYLVNVKSMRKIFSNLVCFSESPNKEVINQL